MDTVDRIFDLVDRQFKEQKDFAAMVGVPNGTVSDWRRRKSASCTKTKYLAKIAEILGTTTDYLSYGTNPSPDRLNEEERELVEAYRQAGDETKAAVRRVLNLKEPESRIASEKAM